MAGNYYLLRFEVSGIKNIEKPIEINFYKKTINNDFDPEQYKIKAIYGENGAGKTAIVTAVRIMQRFLMDKSYLSDSATQKVLVDSVNKKTKSGYMECEFYSEIEGKSLINKYYFSFEVREDNRFYITKERYEVKQGSYSKNKYELIFETENNMLVFCEDKSSLDFFNERTKNLLSQRAFATFLLEKETFSFFKSDTNATLFSMLNLLFFSMDIEVSIDEADNHMAYYWKEVLQGIDEETFKLQGNNLISKIEEDILWSKTGEWLVPRDYYDSYVNQTSQMCSFVKVFKPELVNIGIEKREYDEQFYKCNLKMVYAGYSIDSEFESRGIKKLMRLYGHLDAASRGKIVFIDELDSSINDVYLDKIIEHFIYYGKGQLCFTAHNLSPMNLLKGRRGAITFISSINTVHTWANNGNANPENAYRNGFIEDSPFNVDAASFLGIIGGGDE